jgi:hypothetical protein
MNITSLIQPRKVKKAENQYRYWICKHYDSCLTWAAKKDICFSCVDCPIFKNEENKQNFLVRGCQSPKIKYKCKKCGYIFYSGAENPKCPECLGKKREKSGKVLQRNSRSWDKSNFKVVA